MSGAQGTLTRRTMFGAVGVVAAAVALPSSAMASETVHDRFHRQYAALVQTITEMANGEDWSLVVSDFRQTLPSDDAKINAALSLHTSDGCQRILSHED
jgi:hypothetical protein